MRAAHTLIMTLLFIAGCAGDGISFVSPDAPLPLKKDKGNLFPDAQLKDKGIHDRSTIYACDTIDIL